MGVTDSSPQRPGHALAARLRAELDEQERRARLAQQHLRQHAQTAKKRRNALMADLHAFAMDVEHFRVWYFWNTLRIRYGDRTLRFVARGEEVMVMGEPLSGHCRFDARLSRWFFHPSQGPSVRLFDRGLTLLVEQVLGVSTPVEDD